MSEPVRLDLDGSIVDMLAYFRDYDGPDRHVVLSRWARSDLWGAPLMLCEGWQGKVAREAYDALQHDLSADTPGKAWNAADFRIGRASIHRLLGIGVEAGCAYASAPFRTIEHDGQSWIGGAIGEVVGNIRWTHLDIRDVILWNPRTGETRLFGDAPGQATLVRPDECGGDVAVYGDPQAYFAAWAARRLNTAKLMTAKARGTWAHPVAEPRDGNLPGILVIGAIDQPEWSYVHARRLTADQSVNQHDLHRALSASRNMPLIEGVSGARV